jgi:hypothetical protein
VPLPPAQLARAATVAHRFASAYARSVYRARRPKVPGASRAVELDLAAAATRVPLDRLGLRPHAGVIAMEAIAARRVEATVGLGHHRRDRFVGRGGDRDDGPGPAKEPHREGDREARRGAVADLVSPLVALLALLGGSSSASCGGGVATVAALNSQVPPKLVPIYQRGAAKYKLGRRGPAVLAAINFVETSFGTNMATSSAGANGWMAFMPETWAEWGVDGDGDGDKDSYSAPDAIFSAANYLHDSGAPDDWWEAIFAYNHAGWYVEKVLRYEKEFSAADGHPAGPPSRSSRPTRPRQSARWSPSPRPAWSGDNSRYFWLG